MAPRDGVGFSLHWLFVPAIEGTDRAVRWRWEAHTQTGQLFTQSEESFDTFTECVEDARKHGYRQPT